MGDRQRARDPRLGREARNLNASEKRRSPYVPTLSVRGLTRPLKSADSFAGMQPACERSTIEILRRRMPGCPAMYVVITA